MAEVAWVTLTIWPWRDGWLAEDPDLRAAFDDAGFLDNGVHGGAGERIVGAMNGFAEVDEKRRLVLNGEMQGGSYELREDLDLLEVLRERGIAFHLFGSAYHEWDADEYWWHPEMIEPAWSASTEQDGRVLTKTAFAEMLEQEDPLGRLREFFAAEPLAWEPPPLYYPKLRENEPE